MFADWDEPWIAHELRDGFEAFTDRVLARIARECHELFYVNRCEVCGRIAASPKASICRCGHQWFAQRKSQNQMAEDAFRKIEEQRRN